ncbi:putative uncharacterized protein [Clostridium sp. CAG:356]|nr:putative uncharacterized protein [Clostridium sp. CAG:356]
MNDNNELLIQILQTLNNFQLQTAASFTELRSKVEENKKEIEISRQIENEHWQENLRRWEENDRRWEENEKRWEENERRWEENKKCWEENEKRWEENKILWKQNTKDRERDHSELLDILLKFDITISKRIGDPNAEKMEKYLKVR